MAGLAEGNFGITPEPEKSRRLRLPGCLAVLMIDQGEGWH